MKITYGTTREKALLCSAFLLAAATSAVILLQEQLLSVSLPRTSPLPGPVRPRSGLSAHGTTLRGPSFPRALPGPAGPVPDERNLSCLFVHVPYGSILWLSPLGPPFPLQRVLRPGPAHGKDGRPGHGQDALPAIPPPGLFHRPGIRPPGRDPPGLRPGKGPGRVGLARRRLWAAWSESWPILLCTGARLTRPRPRPRTHPANPDSPGGQTYKASCLTFYLGRQPCMLDQ